MSPIEELARELVDRFCDPQQTFAEKAIREIITRNLFPVVRPEDVEKQQRYWCLIDGNWYVAIGWADRLINDAVEIRGPIPQPEVKE